MSNRLTMDGHTDLDTLVGVVGENWYTHRLPESELRRLIAATLSELLLLAQEGPAPVEDDLYLAVSGIVSCAEADGLI